MTDEQKADADQLLRELITRLPEDLRYTVFGDNLSELERLGFPIPPQEDLENMRRDAVFSPVAQELAKQTAAPSASRVDEMLQQALLAAELSEQTGQNVFAFEEGNPNPVNLSAPSAPPIESEKPAEETVLAPPVPVRRRSLPPSILHPEIKNAERHDFQITEDQHTDLTAADLSEQFLLLLLSSGRVDKGDFFLRDTHTHEFLFQVVIDPRPVRQGHRVYGTGCSRSHDIRLWLLWG